ncbi:splicing factor 3B subunit 2 [Anopheles stephensi]|uniref:PSP proline-rich domain-containing protein n=1 Tax=Anopheles stephensi TaxID=30069 RepID=A0A182YKZ5_ANOST|nr:splicing factor 3B subunit 2 [Anopheles stephensi]
MDNNLEQQTNGTMVPPPMTPSEMLLDDDGMPVEIVDGGGWPVQMVPMMQDDERHPEDNAEQQQTELPEMDEVREGVEEDVEQEDEFQQMPVLSPPPALMSLKVDNPDEDAKKPSELVLPKALEDVLALKTIRAQELDVEETLAAVGAVLPGSYLEPEGALESDDENVNEQSAADVEGDDSSMHGTFSDPGQTRVEGKQDKNRRKKKRKKENRKARREQMQKAHEQRLQQQQQQQQQKQPEKSLTKFQDSKHKTLRTKDPEQEASEEVELAEEDRQDKEGDPVRSIDDSDDGKDTEEEPVKKVNGDQAKNGETEETAEAEDGHHTNGQKEEDDEESTVQADSEENDKEVPPSSKATPPAEETRSTAADEDILKDVEIEYVPEKVTIADLGPMYRQFYRVFEIFKLDTKSKEMVKSAEETEKEKAAAETKKVDDGMDYDYDDMGDQDEKDDKEKISKRKLKKLNRLSVAELKQLVTRPDVVEMHDVTARDPKLLVQLKSHRNTVQVPRHWCFKRKYLQGKRGIEKPPFDLPAFIKKTGIMEMRASLQEKDEAKTLKAKMRERARPKMGKIDIDYQKLHDAFFKWQTKPRMTIHGDLYYEGKEFETRLKEKKPGDLSEELRIALGMPIGPACHKIPPPWLIAQQRYGPPPSYPNLKIPGLNAPIPEGCSFGYHAGGWGKPPVDESGKPLYGDVFGVAGMDGEGGMGEEEIDRTVWGELESESEESSEEEEDEGEDMTAQPDESGLITPAEGLVTPSGLTSGVPAGMETPDTIELRKKKIESEMEDNETPVLYHVLPEKRNERIGAAMMASTHVYDISAAGGGGGGGGVPGGGPAAAAGGGGGRGAGRGGPVDREGMVELALDPSELDLDNEAMAQRYEQQMREQQSHLQKEDLSDMLAEHVARQKSKRKRQQTDTTSKQSKKYKEFKF